jgi:hypothetical protein
MKKISERFSRLHPRSVFDPAPQSVPMLLPPRPGLLERYVSGQALRYAKDGINYSAPVGVLVLMVLGLGFPWWLGFGVAAMVFTGLFFLLNARPPREQEQVDLKSDIRQNLEKSGNTIERLRELAPQVGKTEVRECLLRIAETATNLVQELWANPSTTLTTATRFEFVLAETVRLVEVYLQIQRGQISADPKNVQALVRKIEDDLLPQLQAALTDFAVRLDQSELLNLEATIGVLESTLKLEGLS